MNKPQILKCETLLTTRCDLNCKFCKIAKSIPKEKELTLEQWKKAFKIIYTDLNAPFIPVYGGEVLCLEKEKLLGIIKELSSYKDKGKSYTIISNCMKLFDKKGKIDEEYMKEMMDNGLDSWTSSVDTLNAENKIEKQSWLKSQKGLQVLLKFQEMGLRDCCAISTITKKNLSSIITTAEYLNSKNIWFGADFLHYKKCDGQNDLPSKENLEGLIFDLNDISNICNVIDKLIEMKKEGALIFPTYQVLDMWKNPDYSINLNWKCKEPYCITLYPNGDLWECDSFRGERIKKYSIFDLPEKWNEFRIDYIDDVNESCAGCAWATHICAEEMLKGKNFKYYQHEVKHETNNSG